jgi:mannose-6-phosphate isomerase-like protein (cupin superfamily)
MRYMKMSVIVSALAIASIAPRAADQGSIAYWSADDLKSGHAANMPFMTPTHAFNVLRLRAADARKAESHEGTTDILFVVSGTGRVTAGGRIEGSAPLPGMPGELRGPSMTGGQNYRLTPNAVINIPPSTPYLVQADGGDLTIVRLKVNAGMHPWSIVSTQQTTLGATATHPAVVVPTNARQGDVVFWSGESLATAHSSLSAAADAAKPFNDPRDYVALPATPTHAYNFLHRRMGVSGMPPGVEYHQANTDIYFIVAGTGTVMTEGTIENREPIPGRPGEERGTLIKNGRGLKVKAGDVINMPPNTPHQSIPDPKGFSYMLIKVNTGQYPWALIEK